MMMKSGEEGLESLPILIHAEVQLELELEPTRIQSRKYLRYLRIPYLR